MVLAIFPGKGWPFPQPLASGVPPSFGPSPRPSPRAGRGWAGLCTAARMPLTQLTFQIEIKGHASSATKVQPPVSIALSGGEGMERGHLRVQ
jgi:hypothetical protein